MNETRFWQRLLLLASITIAIVLAGRWFLAPRTAQAASLSHACTTLNDPIFDRTYIAVVVGPADFYEGEEVVAKIGPPGSAGPWSTASLYVGGTRVSSANYPGTLTYVFPSDMNTTIRWEVSGGSAVWDVSCAETVEEPAPAKKNTPQHIPYTGIHLLPEDVAASYYAVPDAEGVSPCGVFDVNGWGRKYVGLTDFPACTAPVSVRCLNGDGEWTADTVGDVVMQGDWEVDFTSHQHGICGLFSQ